jgi:K(+)-stimulated pyrophosphate-energized sodium pump
VSAPTAPASAAMATPAAPASMAAPTATAAADAKFLFDSGKADLPANAAESITKLAATAKAGAGKLVISGFHDATGDPAKNAELAKLRAFAVRDALKAAGIAEDRIELKKPEQINAGSADDARRVEVKLM